MIGKRFTFGNDAVRLPFPARTQTTRGPTLIHEYRGHRIHLFQAERWTAELVELATGALLPTKLTAAEDESFHALATRARQLVDLYLEVDTTVRVLSPIRPWQTILSRSQCVRRQ